MHARFCQSEHSEESFRTFGERFLIKESIAFLRQYAILVLNSEFCIIKPSEVVNMKVREAIYTRRTIRKFRPEPISDDVLRELVEAARFAPSASNMQPLKYKLVGSVDAARVFPHVHWAGAIRPAGDPKPGEEPTAYILILADTDIRKAETITRNLCSRFLRA